ncbi:hypothetical protein GM415_03060 [Pseudodesulfovibrio cashew]|uniref:Uncharacterized protein n=1 Tax=Pseudodesulfovibrio cashew TaxID=2678688 RepID=A0A6I6JL92_9BACT|nr:hypothetical protein [Pseudodesulfovibrio cashew]QGY41969.1 hypothetical protein GM415_03060 [Pseudodesulfovibrio cashew]
MKAGAWRGALLCVALALVAATSALAQDEPLYDANFDVPAVEEKHFEFWGQAELRMYERVLNRNSAAYEQRFFKSRQDELQTDLLLQLKPELSVKYETFGIYARPRADVAWSQLPLSSVSEPDEPSERFFKDDKHWAGQVLLEEGVASWRPDPQFTLEAGKKVLKWGKGYAWNPVSFASRPKDVDDPDQSREGYVMGVVDAIFSFDGPLKTFAFTPVVVPVWERVNTGLATKESVLYGGKLYFLISDVDMDVMAMTGDYYDTSFGVDFAANITENFAIHGETAVRLGHEQTVFNDDGTSSIHNHDAWSFLLGARYLTESETTYLLEYYHNGEGYTSEQLKSYYDYVHAAYDTYQSTGIATDLNKSKQVSSDYNKSSAGKDYLYFRVSQKEPFDILYLTTTATVIMNLGDRSLSLNPEASYLLTSNLELRPRLTLPIGDSDTEFGNKLNAAKGELRCVYYF